MKPKIILASASERRSKILTECGIPHKIIVSNVEEVIDPKKSAGTNALLNACNKAQAVAKKIKTGFIIGADTIVLYDHKLVGKPANRAEAVKLLKAFSSRTISVYTGLCVINTSNGKLVKAVVESKIKVRRIDNGIIDKFIKACGPYDKAGGFSIEGMGTFLFDNVQGSFYNILGLPTMKLYEMFKELGVDLLNVVRQ